MSTWAKEIGAMTLHVADLDQSRTFYQDVFGLPAVQAGDDTVMFRFANMYVFLHEAAAAGEAPKGPVLDAAMNGAGQFAIIVADVDAASADLLAAGVQVLSGPGDRDWGMRTVTFADPSGHVWEIAQELTAS